MPLVEAQIHPRHHQAGREHHWKRAVQQTDQPQYQANQADRQRHIASDTNCMLANATTKIERAHAHSPIRKLASARPENQQIGHDLAHGHRQAGHVAGQAVHVHVEQQLHVAGARVHRQIEQRRQAGHAGVHHPEELDHLPAAPQRLDQFAAQPDRHDVDGHLPRVQLHAPEAERRPDVERRWQQVAGRHAQRGHRAVGERQRIADDDDDADALDRGRGVRPQGGQLLAPQRRRRRSDGQHH